MKNANCSSLAQSRPDFFLSFLNFGEKSRSFLAGGIALPGLILLFLLISMLSNQLMAQSFNFDPQCGTGPNPTPIPGGVAPDNLICDNNFAGFLSKHTDDMIPQGINGKVKVRVNVLFVQNANGEGNFSTSSSQDMEFWKKIFERANATLENLFQESCDCTIEPVHYNNIHLELVPNYIEIRDNYAWDHTNDPDPTIYYSYSKPYLNYISNLAQQSSGINMIITTDKQYYEQYFSNNREKPLWELGYEAGFYNGFWYSAYPTFDLSHQPMWHAPDAYLWYINGYDHLGGDWWLETEQIPFYAGGVLHECGHYFDLVHSSDACVNNIMKKGASTDMSFTGCQVRKMYLSMMLKNLRSSIICDDKLDFNLNVDTDETWKLNMRVLGDVVVKNGATLTVTCQLHMSPKSRIIVERGGKLIIDGGLLTGDCNDKWKGIIVEGDVVGAQTLSGKVILKNDAIIENARDGISMNPSHRDWDNGNLQNYYGGWVDATNSTIRNCTRGVEFMRYGQGGKKDKSTFNNVKFENLYEGVTMWADDGVTFDNCKFQNIGKRGVLPFDCEVFVRSGNTFQGLPVGVDAITTYPIIFSSDIGDKGLPGNTFACSDAGVHIQSSGNVEPFTILNNIFTGGKKGITQNGNGLLDVQNNRLTGQLTSVELYENGTSWNGVRSNEIQGAYLGAHSIKANSGLQYWTNCFTNSSLVDIFISDGDIFPFQGNSSIAAGNCFTKLDIPEMDNDAGTGSVFYFVKSGTPTTSCKYPEELRNVTLVNSSSLDPASICGPNWGEEEPNDCQINADAPIAALKIQRLTMIQQLAAMSNDVTFSRKSLERCIETIESAIARKMLDPESTDQDAGKENAIAFYNSTGMDFKDRTNAFGIMLNYGETTRARNYLNSLNAVETEEQYFTGVQQINLDRLEQGSNFELSTSARQYLYNVGTSDGAYNGYARSLYEVLTGERIEVKIPEPKIGERNAYQQSDNRYSPLTVTPNPVREDEISVVIDEQIKMDVPYTITIIDAAGRVRHERSINQGGTHHLSGLHLASGVYLMTLTGPDKHIGTTRFIVIH